MLKVSNLRKEFDTVLAVDGVSLEVRRGELFGLLGPNGAGKTTTIRTVLNIIKPDRGEITFDGKQFTPATWNIIGYLPEERGLYRKSRIINTIQYFASLKGVPESEAKTRAVKWLERFSLAGRAYDKVEELSKGNQQKVQLITALLHDPQLLILDEPFSGLDPVNQILLKDILLELRQRNVAIIFSTHQMEQVEKMCDNICLINKGQPVLHGSLRDIKRQYGKNSVHLEFEGDGSFLKSLNNVRRADVYQNYAEIELLDVERTNEFLSHLNGKLAIRKFEIVEPSLNQIFVQVVGPPPEMPAEPTGEKQGSAPRAKQPTDRRIKRAILNMALTSLIAVALSFFTLQEAQPKKYVFNLSVALIALSVFSYFRTKRKVEAEKLRQQGGDR